MSTKLELTIAPASFPRRRRTRNTTTKGQADLPRCYKWRKELMYKIIYKDVILFRTSNKNEAIDAILDYATKRGLTFDKKIKFFGRIYLIFYDINNYYTYTIIKE